MLHTHSHSHTHFELFPTRHVRNRFHHMITMTHCTMIHLLFLHLFYWNKSHSTLGTCPRLILSHHRMHRTGVNLLFFVHIFILLHIVVDITELFDFVFA